MLNPAAKLKGTHKKNPTTPNLIKLILDMCKNFLTHDEKCSNKLRCFSQALERCDAPVNMKLQSLLDSPYQKHVPINRNFFPAEMNHYYHINKKIEENIN